MQHTVLDLPCTVAGLRRAVAGVPPEASVTLEPRDRDAGGRSRRTLLVRCTWHKRPRMRLPGDQLALPVE